MRMAQIFSQMGIRDYVVRKMVIGERERPVVMGTASLLSFFSALFVVISLLPLIFFLHYNSIQRFVIVILLLSVFPEIVNYVVDTAFQSIERMSIFAIVSFSSSILRILLVLGAVFFKASLLVITILISLSYFFGGFLYVFFYRRTFSLPFIVSVEFLKRMLRGIIHFAVASVTGVLFTVFPVIYLSKVRPISEVGFFRVGSMAFSFGLMWAESHAIASYPYIIRKLGNAFDREGEVSKLFRKGIWYFGLPLSLFLFLLSGPIIRFLFSKKYELAIPVMEITVLGIVFSQATRILMRVYYAQGEEKRVALFSTFSTLFAVSLSFFIIPSLGAIGTSWISLSGRVLSLGLFIWGLPKGIDRSDYLSVFLFSIPLFVVATLSVKVIPHLCGIPLLAVIYWIETKWGRRFF